MITKCIDRNCTRENTCETKLRGPCDHVKLSSAVSASGQVFTPLVVLPGQEAKYCKRGEGNFETPSNFLPKPNDLFMIPTAGVTYNIFYLWVVKFVKETDISTRGGKKLLMVMDGYACSTSDKTLSLLNDNNSIVADLPVNTSDVGQALEAFVLDLSNKS